MGDVTRARFHEMLECVEDPSVDYLDRHFRGCVFYSDVLLGYSNGSLDARERIRLKGIAPCWVWPSNKFLLSTCRGTRLGMGEDGRARVERKVAKYKRWLEEWRRR